MEKRWNHTYEWNNTKVIEVIDWMGSKVHPIALLQFFAIPPMIMDGYDNLVFNGIMAIISGIGMMLILGYAIWAISVVNAVYQTGTKRKIVSTAFLKAEEGETPTSYISRMNTYISGRKYLHYGFFVSLCALGVIAANDFRAAMFIVASIGLTTEIIAASIAQVVSKLNEPQ